MYASHLKNINFILFKVKLLCNKQFALNDVFVTSFQIANHKQLISLKSFIYPEGTNVCGFCCITKRFKTQHIFTLKKMCVFLRRNSNYI